MNSFLRFGRTLRTLRSSLIWGLRPALLTSAAVAALGWQGRPDFSNWRDFRAKCEISLNRTKLIAVSQFTRMVFAEIHKLAGFDSPGKGAASPEAARAAVAFETAMKIPALAEQVNTESAEVQSFAEEIVRRRASKTESAAGWAALQCEAFTRLGDIDILAGHAGPALVRYQAALAIATEAKAPLVWCDTARHLQCALALQGRTAEAELLARQLVEVRTVHQGRTHPETIAALNTLAIACEEKGDALGAENLFAQVLVIQELVFGKEHPGTVQSLARLAASLKSKGDFVRAIPLHRRLLGVRERTLGNEHPETLKSMNDLAVLLCIESDRASAETLYRRGLERVEFRGQENLRATQFLEIAMLGREDGYAEAEALFRRGLDACERRLGKDDVGTLMNLKNLGGLLVAQGRFEEAASFLERGLTGLSKISPRNSRTLMSLMETVAYLREKQGRLSEALPLAEELLGRIRQTQPSGGREREVLEKWFAEMQERAARIRQDVGINALKDSTSNGPHAM